MESSETQPQETPSEEPVNPGGEDVDHTPDENPSEEQSGGEESGGEESSEGQGTE